MVTDRQAKLFAFHAGISCIRAARALEATNPKRARAYYSAAWSFFVGWAGI